MGSLAFLIIMGILVVLGLGATVVGLIGLIICAKKQHKALSGIFTAVMIVGILLIVFPGILVGGILYTNTVPPADFVETHIVIEGDIYQDDSFTADGITYRKLELIAQDEPCRMAASPVFSYMPDGILNRSQWCNLYRLENGQNFDLIWDGYSTFYCPEDQADTITDYYENGPRMWLYYTDVLLSEEAAAAMELYADWSGDQITELSDETAVEVNITCCSEDGLVLLHDVWFLVTADSVYEELTVEYDAASNRVLYTACQLPDELVTPLLADILENAQ